MGGFTHKLIQVTLRLFPDRGLSDRLFPDRPFPNLHRDIHIPQPVHRYKVFLLTGWGNQWLELV